MNLAPSSAACSRYPHPPDPPDAVGGAEPPAWPSFRFTQRHSVMPCSLLVAELTLHAGPLGGGRVAVHPFRLRAPFSELLEVRRYQVVHEPAGLQ